MLLTSRRFVFLIAAIFCGAIAANAEPLRLPKFFSDNMVLQQNTSVPIWGWGEEGTTVTVNFRGQTATAKVVGGKWTVRLGSFSAGGPDVLSVVDNGKVIRIKNVFVGEVWLASGQSNMEFPLNKSFAADIDIVKSANPKIHLLHVPHAQLDSPADDINATWTECNPETVPTFSAVAYYFARDLQKALGVPVGIIESSVGGTPIEAWMGHDYLESIPRYHEEVFAEWAVAQDQYERALAAYNQEKAEAKKDGTEFKKKAPRQPWKPSELYNGMIAPLAGYAMKGALWYQGESNAGSEEDAWVYHSLLLDLIRDWRKVWNEGNFPVMLVQLAPFMEIQTRPSESSWASVREAELQATQKLPDVGLAVITDVGDEHNIHPTRKGPVGGRLALAALGIAYHKPIEYSGPVVKRVKVEDDQIVLTFSHVDGGLVAEGPELEGFAICGADGKFVWAQAEIKGKDQILVHSVEVPHPKAVRFGWANYPVVNLYNKIGLPASPFRTDDFELIPATAK